ncbi:MAG: AAA family ATPase [Euryarchaeota archaeon]|nr:AAA family ATPase [Euryarchaeota archaeon]
MKVNARERVLVYLSGQPDRRGEFDAPLERTQEGIAQGINARQNTASCALTALGSEGLLEWRMAHIKGQRQRCRAYYLTEAGHAASQSARRVMAGLDVSLVRADGRRTMVRLGGVGSVLGTPNDLALVASLLGGDGSVRENDVRAAFRSSGAARDLAEMPVQGRIYGRKAEIKSITSWLASPDDPALVITGPSGIGKTALAVAAVDALGKERDAVWVRCGECRSPQRLAQRLSAYLERLGCYRLSRALGESDLQPARLREAVRKDAGAVSALFVIDDAQLLEPGCAPLVLGIAHGAGPSGSKLLLLTRGMQGWMGPLAGSAMPLKGLDFEAAWNMVRHTAVPEERFQDVYRATQGHPLLLSIASMALPAGRADAVSDIVQEDEMAVLRLMAVARKPLPRRYLTARGQPPDRALASLREKGMAIEGEGDLWEAHGVVRSMVLTAMKPAQVRAGHSALARLYMSSKLPLVGLEAVYHASFARRHGLALDMLEGLSARLVAEGAHGPFSDAVDQARGFAGAARGGDRLRWLLLKARALMLSGDFPTSLRLCREAIGGLKGAAQSRARALAALLHVEMGERGEALAESSRALAALSKSDSEWHLASLLAMAVALEQSNDVAGLSRCGSEGLRLAGGSGGRLAAEFEMLMSRTMHRRGRGRDSQAHLSAAREYVSGVLPPYDRALAEGSLARTMLFTGRAEEALRIAMAVISDASRNGWLPLKGSALLTCSEAHLALGQRREAEVKALRALPLARRFCRRPDIERASRVLSACGKRP